MGRRNKVNLLRMAFSQHSANGRLVAIVLLVLTVALCLFAYVRRPLSVDLKPKMGATDAPKFQQRKPVKMPRQCSDRAVLCGAIGTVNYTAESTSVDILRAKMHKLVTTVNSSLCPNILRFGNPSGGGYNVCVSEPFAPKKNNCLVYSFGISNDWQFDEAGAQYGCEVHSFDPSINQKDHIHQPGPTHFHNLGLWGSDIVDGHGWALNKLSTIRRKLGHDKRIIDVLKIDVELAEWPFLRDVLDEDESEPLNTIKQFIVEIHTPRYAGQTLSAGDVSEMIHYFDQLTDSTWGRFAIINNRQVQNCCYTFTGMMPKGVAERCCHEVFLVNMRFMDSNKS